MTLYAALRLVHVIVAVLGAGSIAAIALVSRKERPRPLAASSLPTLLAWASGSLAALLITGIWMDVEMRGVLHTALWFRASAIMLVLTGATLGIMRRQLAAGAVARVAVLTIIANALVLAIVVLMERRPT